MRRRNTEAPIIIKKGKKNRHEFHGGNWKVAMADFMTSMFIFFLLLWLLNIVSQEQQEGIADFFAPASVSRNPSGANGLLEGTSIVVDGTLAHPGAPPIPVFGAGGGEGQREQTEVDDFPPDDAEPLGTLTVPDEFADQVRRCLASEFRDCQAPARDVTGLAAGIGTGVDLPPGFVTPEGVEVDFAFGVEGFKITLREVDGQPMFESGSSRPLPRLESALMQIAPLLQNFPNKIKVVGHTDAVAFSTGATGGRSNWELSSERANASRRVLVQSGMPADKVSEITAKAASEPFEGLRPEEAGNRRIDIILLNERPPVFAQQQPAAPIEASPVPQDGLFGNGQNGGRTEGRNGGRINRQALGPPASLQEDLSITR